MRITLKQAAQEAGTLMLIVAAIIVFLICAVTLGEWLAVEVGPAAVMVELGIIVFCVLTGVRYLVDRL